MMSRFGYLVALSLVAAPAAAAEKSKTPPDPDKMVCKRVAETGSLARVKKHCLTQRQWKQLDEASREQARQMQTSVPGSSN